MDKISIQFFCGHFEALDKKQIKQQKITLNGKPFKINDKWKATSGQYCLNCSNFFKNN